MYTWRLNKHHLSELWQACVEYYGHSSLNNFTKIETVMSCWEHTSVTNSKLYSNICDSVSPVIINHRFQLGEDISPWVACDWTSWLLRMRECTVLRTEKKNCQVYCFNKILKHSLFILIYRCRYVSLSLESSWTFKHKEDCLKGELSEIALNSKKQLYRYLYRGINVFKKGTLPWEKKKMAICLHITTVV